MAERFTLGVLRYAEAQCFLRADALLKARGPWEQTEAAIVAWECAKKRCERAEAEEMERARDAAALVVEGRDVAA